MADLAERIGFHLEGVVAAVRAVRGEPHTRDLSRDGPRLFIGQWAPGLLLHLGGPEPLQVRERDVVQRRHRDAVTRRRVELDAHFRPGGQRRAPGGVVHAVRHLREVNRVGIADPEFRRGAIGHDVRRLAALGDDPLDLGLRAHRFAQAVDVIEQLDHAHQRVASVPCLQLVRRGAEEGVVHDVDVHAAAAEAGPGRLRRGGRMRADQDVRALENARIVHDGLRGGRRELFGRYAVYRHRARRLGAREELRDGDGRGQPHGSLSAMLVAVEVAAGAAQRVVLDDDAEVRAGRALAVTRHEGRLETRHPGLDVEAVRGEIVGEDLHRALFLPAGLGVTGDVVGHHQELPVHQVLGPGDHGVAPRVARNREPRHERRQGERALELVHPADDVGGGGLFGWCLLGRGAAGGDEQGDERKAQCSTHRVTSGGAVRVPGSAGLAGT